MSKQVTASWADFSWLRLNAKLDRIYCHVRIVLKNITTAAPADNGDEDGGTFEVFYDSVVSVIRESTKNGRADRMARPIEQDPASWQAGYKAGLEENTDHPQLFVPPGTDEVSFYFGLVKGRSDRNNTTTV